MSDQRSMDWRPIVLAVLIAVLVVRNKDAWTQLKLTPASVSQITYVYDVEQSVVPRAIVAALREINESGVQASSIDVGTIDGTGQIPDQYAIAIQCAKDKGVPILVVQSEDSVIKTVASPKVEDLQEWMP